MKNTFLILGFVAVFGIGLFLGVKIIDNNKSVYMYVGLGDIGEFTIGKQLDLSNLGSFHPNDKAVLISGMKKLSPNDDISTEMVDLALSGKGPFTPKHYSVRLHITKDSELKSGIAAVCERMEADFFRKTVSIFDNSKISRTPNIIRVGAWNTHSNSLCFNNKLHHIWIGFETAKLLFPAESNELSVGNEIDLYARVSTTCNLPNHKG
jgi:hypothetical protein